MPSSPRVYISMSKSFHTYSKIYISAILNFHFDFPHPSLIYVSWEDIYVSWAKENTYCHERSESKMANMPQSGWCCGTSADQFSCKATIMKLIIDYWLLTIVVKGIQSWNYNRWHKIYLKRRWDRSRLRRWLMVGKVKSWIVLVMVFWRW